MAKAHQIKPLIPEVWGPYRTADALERNDHARALGSTRSEGFNFNSVLFGFSLFSLGTCLKRLRSVTGSLVASWPQRFSSISYLFP